MNNCHYSYILNGSSCGFVKAKRGLRQGDPLSPSLFILASEFFTRGINKLFAENPAMFYDSKRTERISHLAYADDCIIFCKGQKKTLKAIMEFLKLFEEVSGQKISVEKSQIFAGKNANKALILEITGMNVSQLPFTYLDRKSVV